MGGHAGQAMSGFERSQPRRSGQVTLGGGHGQAGLEAWQSCVRWDKDGGRQGGAQWPVRGQDSGPWLQQGRAQSELRCSWGRGLDSTTCM